MHPGEAKRHYLVPSISDMRFCISAIRSIKPDICFIRTFPRRPAVFPLARDSIFALRSVATTTHSLG